MILKINYSGQVWTFMKAFYVKYVHLCQIFPLKLIGIVLLYLCMYVCIYVFAYLFILHCIALRFFPERYAVV